jgi:hypothetical protein
MKRQDRGAARRTTSGRDVKTGGNFPPLTLTPSLH